MPALKRKVISDVPMEWKEFSVEVKWERGEDASDEEGSESEYEFKAETAKEGVDELNSKYGQEMHFSDIENEIQAAADHGDHGVHEVHRFDWGAGEYVVTVSGVEELSDAEGDGDEDVSEEVPGPSLKLPKRKRTSGSWR